MKSPDPNTGPQAAAASSGIVIRGARQHNLKNLNINIATGTLTVVTGPSGSGKSSLVFDTLFAEGQRRYVETFSAYARQFLDRMDKPAVDAVEGVPPAIGIAQSNPVRNSRSTVGTMTELNDYLKLLFARAGRLFDADTALPVRQDSLATIEADLQRQLAGKNPRVQVVFALDVPAGTSLAQMQEWLQASGFTRVSASADGQQVEVVADRFRWQSVEPVRLQEALEVALRHGSGRVQLVLQEEAGEPQRLSYATDRFCPESGRSYLAPTPALFSFNSAHGACAHCRGFGRVIGVDLDLVIPQPSLTLRQGAIKPMQTPAWREAQADLLRHAAAEGIRVDVPYADLSEAEQDWVVNGSPLWRGNWTRQWFGVHRFFEYLESKAYKMHIRVLLSKYRSYTLCPVCDGARLQTESLLWRVGSRALAAAVLAPEQRFLPQGVAYDRAALARLPGLNMHDVMRLPLAALHRWVQGVAAEREQQTDNTDSANSTDSADAKAQDIVLREILARVGYLVDVGLGYLTLERQSRTLSGGELQRINLSTALGTALTQTLFVLDEPSIGLHPHDMARINQAMLRLRDAGNTLVVVEHDPQVMQVADRIVDMGPGPGAAGGQIVFDGRPAELAAADTLTGRYLGGRKALNLGTGRPLAADGPQLELLGVRANNLQAIDVRIPLGGMVCITGVSGSGKSTLVQDVLAPALQRHFGRASDSPGAFSALLGAEALADMVFVDQSPIGKSARSTPVSYIGAWDAVRDLFAASPLAQELGLTRASFSFNTGTGRCPTCGGSGFEHIEMQFLSDVYLRCEDCQGQRFRAEVLQVQIERGGRQLHVADCLALTVAEALALFADDWALHLALQPLLDVGLGYVQLGQAVPTLSGGEAQRLKIAGHLAESAKKRSNSRQALARKGTLFVFDEPTTGLHFEDIAKLMQALRKLQVAGHSLLLVEHNMDVIAACDWLIDLGPEAGAGGGQIVATGSPQTVQASASGHTADALREYARSQQAWQAGEVGTAYAPAATAQPRQIEVVQAHEHNLQGLSVTIPHGQMTVVTGVSGSGKSTLAFDIVFSEGQRRYLESLNAYARSIVQPPARPEVDAVYGLAPTVAIEQRLSRGGYKSTVGTITEIWHFLRLLYVKLGVQHCIHDGAAVQPQNAEQIAADLERRYAGQHIGLLAPMVRGRKGIYTELAAWAHKLGYSHLRVDGAFVPTAAFPKLARYQEHQIELPIADVHIGTASSAQVLAFVQQALSLGKGALQVLAPLDGLVAAFAGLDADDLANQSAGVGLGLGQLRHYSSARACPECATSYAELDPRLFSYNSKHGWCPDCVGTGRTLERKQRQQLDGSLPDKHAGREQSLLEADVGELGDTLCASCACGRLNATARAVRFTALLAADADQPAQTLDASITELAQLSIAQLQQRFARLQLSGRAADIAQDLLPEIRSRLQFLQDVGLGYLSLDRAAPTLSGGEAQRIRLAAQLGSHLQGVCYVLDEPTIGLHARDNQMLLGALQQLRAGGNTLIVVEHDEDTIRQADYVIDIGPGAGRRGGRLLATGSVAEVQQVAESVTGRYLGEASRYTVAEAKPAAAKSLDLQGVRMHNLCGLDVSVPLERLVVVTGVSGSGKSTLARDVLLTEVQTQLHSKGQAAPQRLSGLTGWQHIDRVLEVDQTPIGKTPRSCPATYIGFWDAIRRLFADTNEARARGYTASRFSFNTGPGRCPGCEGQGMRTVSMSFLPDVKVLCETCHGARFNPQTLAVQWRGQSIGDILRMEVDDALEFFASMPAIAHPLQLLQDVGLGYLQLGQPSPTLSGGEAQRLKLVTELSKVRDEVGRRGQRSPRTLYVLDEPSVGLHMADVQRLIAVLQRLVAGGHSVVVVEHDLDLIAKADWVIDMGPEGGQAGGQLVASASPAALLHGEGHTAAALRQHLARRFP